MNEKAENIKLKQSFYESKNCNISSSSKYINISLEKSIKFFKENKPI